MQLPGVPHPLAGLAAGPLVDWLTQDEYLARCAGCHRCHPEIFNPICAPIHEGHLAIRFDVRLAFAFVYLNGEPIMDCYEVVAGPGGHALRHMWPLRSCPCGSGNVMSYRQESDGFSVLIDPRAYGKGRVVPPRAKLAYAQHTG